MSQRQFIMGSPIGVIAGGAANSEQTVTITASEPGVLHLDTLVLQCGQNAASAIPSASVISNFVVTSILAYNAIEMVRGRNTPNPPAGAFWGYRGTNPIRLGDWNLQAGDTVAVTVEAQTAGANLQASTLSAQAAFTPTMVRQGVPEPAGPCTYAASPTANPAAGAAANATITFDENGIFSLESINAVVMAEPIAAAAAGAWIDGSAQSTLTALTLPNGNALILGQNDPVLSVESIAAGYRSYSFGKLGAIPVSAGDTIVATFDNASAVAHAVSFGGRFYPQMPLVRGRGC